MLKTSLLFARHLKGKSTLITTMILLGLAGSASSLATPLIGKTFIDNVVGKGNFALLPRLALILFSLAIADLILGSCSRLVHTKLSAGVLVELRERLFAQCMRAPLVDLERFRHGDLLNRFGADIAKIQSLLVDGMLGCFQNCLFLVVAAVILLRLSITLALWSFLGIFAALVITVAFRAPVEKWTRVVRDAMVDLSHFLAERLGALRAIRFHAAQQSDQATFAAHNALLVSRLLKFQTLDAAASGFPGLILTASLAWIYLVGGRQIESGAISLGTFVAFILYQGRLVSPAMGLLGLVRNLQEARISLERVAEVLANETHGSVPADDGVGVPGSILLEGVSFAYAGSSTVLDKLDLRVAEGERVAVFGVSGSGKSTLAQILFGLRTPHQGRVSISCGDGGGASHAIGVPRLGYAGCEPFLMHATIEENLRYGNRSISSTEIQKATLLAEAHEFITGLPHGYNTVIGGRGAALSDGQRQRLGLARLILRNPGIIVLDEAFSALDPGTESKVRQNLFRHFSDRTFLVISHSLLGLDDFNRLYLMERGQLRQIEAKKLISELGDMPILRDAPVGGKVINLLDSNARRRHIGRRD